MFEGGPLARNQARKKISLITISFEQSKENSMSGVQHYHMSGVQQLFVFNKQGLSALDRTQNQKKFSTGMYFY